MGDLERESAFLSFNFTIFEGISFAIQKDITSASTQRDNAQKSKDRLNYGTHG